MLSHPVPTIQFSWSRFIFLEPNGLSGSVIIDIEWQSDFRLAREPQNPQRYVPLNH